MPIYHQFIPASVNFGHFLLFTGTAMSITAFPVLCRILTELKLLETTVGVVVLSAGVGNDVVGWILLALTVALVNAEAGGEGSGVTAVYILLCAVGWTLVRSDPLPPMPSVCFLADPPRDHLPPPCRSSSTRSGGSCAGSRSAPARSSRASRRRS